jgi:hypothetical protein
MKELNLNLVKKDSKTYEIRLSRNDLPVNISGWTVSFYVKLDFNDLDSAALIAKNYTFPSNSESISGIGYLALTSTETNIAVGEYYYDFKFVDGTYRETFLHGKMVVIPSIRIA